jgi:hypothetical protein
VATGCAPLFGAAAIARVDYVRTIPSVREFTKSRSFLAKLVDFVAGPAEDKPEVVRPNATTHDSTGRLLVADPGQHGIHIYDFEKRKYQFVKGLRKRELISPIDVACDKNDGIYVSDSVRAKIYVCHAPHNVQPNVLPLWDHALSTVTYTPYASTTYTSGAQTPNAGSSKLCLSCHDGTVAVGLTVTQGLIATTGSMSSSDKFGTDLSHSHPMSMTMVDDGSLVSSLFATPASTKNPAVLLVSGKIECTTCHDPHVPNKDNTNNIVNKMFLVGSNSGSAIWPGLP